MATQQNNKWIIIWLIIGVMSLAITAIAYYKLGPNNNTQINSGRENQKSSINKNQQTASLANLPLNKAINLLAEQYEVKITIDNPYMENCPFPTLQTSNRPLREILVSITRQFEMELHEAAPDDYILIGGTCN